MNTRKFAVGLLALVAMTIAVKDIAQSPRLAITHVNVIDVVDGRILPNSTVTIGNTSIISVVRDGAPPAGTRVIEARDEFLIPGLWDMHAHTQLAGESWLALYVANGVTGIRDMGSDLEYIMKMREETASGRVLGPRIFAAGPILDNAPGDWPFRIRVKTPEEGRAAVQLLKRRGVDLIKVHDHTPREAFFAIVAEARRLDLPVAGHLPIGVTVEDAINAGQGDIEHLANLQLWSPCSGGETYRSELCRPLFDMLARQGIWQTPTLAASFEIGTIGTSASESSANRLVYASKEVREAWAGNPVTPAAIRQFRARAQMGATVASDMAKAGVPILAGCDIGFAGFCVHDELAAMVRGGMTPLAALQTATVNPGELYTLFP